MNLLDAIWYLITIESLEKMYDRYYDQYFKATFKAHYICFDRFTRQKDVNIKSIVLANLW